eukprot:TRINITY_DN30184_c0_g1_i1.p1 TRINITY_DN30184_c0_g1~~TRINITY_DN30184_c0_g1_i1.p1  ORF type:complete len:1013 (-),score=188.80 TRINITY_DN30184_c0_g1_i1:456-3494(-)
MQRLLVGGDTSGKCLSPKSRSRGSESPKKSWWSTKSLSTASSTASGDTMDPADLKDDELLCPVGIESYSLLLSRSHETHDSAGSKMTLYLKLAGEYSFLKTTVAKAQQTSDGKGLEATASYRPESRPRLLLHDDDPGCVLVEAYLKHTMRKDTLCGRGNLSSGAIFDRIASDYEGRCTVSIEIFNTNDVSENRQSLPKELVGEVRFVFVQEESCFRESSSWAAANVRRWMLGNRLPSPPSTSHCFRAVETLIQAPAPPLLEELLGKIHEIEEEEVARLGHKSKDDHLQEVRRFTTEVMKLEDQVRKVPGFIAENNLKLHSSREQLASCLFDAAMQSHDHRKMKAALVGATILGCTDTNEFKNGESDFRSALRIPDYVRLEELLDDHVDGEYRQPADGGFVLVEDRPSPPEVDETVRYRIRDEVALRVLLMLGCAAPLQPSKGFTYQVVATKHITSPGFKMPTLVAELMRHVVLFRGELDVSGLDENEVAEFRRDAGINSMNALLTRFDLVAQPVFAEFGADFRPVASSPVASSTGCLPLPGSAGGARQKQRCDSSVSIVGGPGWFWVLHGAAINVGETAQAEDFGQYSMPAPVDELSRKAKLANDQVTCRVLDENKYVHDIGELWRCAFDAAAQLAADDIVVFPWGMGAFLRNLHLLDSIYGDAVKMRHLKSRMADGLFKAAASTPAVTRIHVCLMDNSYESRVNYNVIVERGIANAKKHPELASRVKFYRNVDSFGVASRLSNKQQLMTTHRADEVRRVVLLNGANRKLLGNHWFANGARTAIDENLHRRSTVMSLGSLLLNGGATITLRMPGELAKKVGTFGGRILNTSSKPYRGEGPTMLTNTEQIGGKSDDATAQPGSVGACTPSDAKLDDCAVDKCDYAPFCLNIESKTTSGLCSGACGCCADSPNQPPSSCPPSFPTSPAFLPAVSPKHGLLESEQVLSKLSVRSTCSTGSSVEDSVCKTLTFPAPGGCGGLSNVSTSKQPLLDVATSPWAALLPLPPTAAQHVAH